MTINIAHGERTDLLTGKKLIEKYTGKKLDSVRRLPRFGDIRHPHADISLARRTLSDIPRINLAKGLKRTVQWYTGRKSSRKNT